MKAIILSAGQGKRLLPLTARLPKCAVAVADRPLIEWQLDHLATAGVEDVTVVTGFGAAHVEALLAQRRRAVRAQVLYNPSFAVADNLVSCWMARAQMTSDFVLLNGDTVFEPAVLQRLLAAPAHPVTVAINRKAHYDDDDMKVRLDGERLLEVGKGLPLARVDGESIGMMRFSGAGPLLFRDALERAVRHRGSRRQFYLSVVDELAKAGQVRVCDISGLDWSEVDYPLDLSRASRMAANWVTAAGAQVSSAG